METQFFMMPLEKITWISQKCFAVYLGLISPLEIIVDSMYYTMQHSREIVCEFIFHLYNFVLEQKPSLLKPEF